MGPKEKDGTGNMLIDRRIFLRGCGALSLPAMLCATRLFAQSPDELALSHVHPELRPMARHILPMLRSRGALSSVNLAKERAAAAGYAQKPSADIRYEKREIEGAKGQPPITLYVVNAGQGQGRPAIFHTHGGGFVSGSAAASIAPLQALCRELGCVAVSAEYRLAPETDYRGSIEDNYAGLKWLHHNAAMLGVDPARIAVMGESAGGGHAALLAITARDRGEVPVAFQCLIYPMLDDRTGSSRAVPPHIGQIIWTAESNRFGWRSFLGMEPGTSRTPVAAVPARNPDLTGLPPAFIGVGSIDLFVDEDIDYAQRLNAAAVPTELIVVPGAFHGFDSLPMKTSIAENFNMAKLTALRRGLGIA